MSRSAGPHEASVSIVVAAHNEERQLENTINTVLDACERWFSDHEILVFNDGSEDRTPSIANDLAARHPTVHVTHHARALGLGGVFKRGLAIASKDYVILINGKNDTPPEALDRIFALAGSADMVIPFTANSRRRPFLRRIVSLTFTEMLNRLFYLDLEYYNHSVLYRREDIRSVHIRSASYAFQAEALIKLIKRGYSYVEVGVDDAFDPEHKTRSFRAQNVIGVSGFFVTTVYDVYLGERGLKPKPDEGDEG